MKNIKYLVSAVALSMMTSCDPSDFGDINKDPNNASTAIASFLLTLLILFCMNASPTAVL